MDRRFFRLGVDVYMSGRWYLTEPRNLAGEELKDGWQFMQGRRVELREKLKFPVRYAGKPLDYTTAGAGQIPVVNEKVASVFRDLALNDVQLFSVEVEGQEQPYSLLNVTREVRCIDDAACEEVQRYGPDDGRPERVGEYRAVSGLRIDKSKVGNARIFRLWGWHPPIIVDEEIKDALERTGIVGGQFDEV
ncbi:hypothetical protein D7V97_26240 [Corallococcus sp. CA053C]|uniref:imm11 family protein n=1 Tax=Corallococcus sp. CA053C TaxID=2316732 RepID=UPI000EA10BBA|nr:DUF1629 domain-containing protein [Corallococcus sp. CA053C]RKH03764.1 hypothetical protein D7V97_26240 [Corallococcus sp. CA053C]